MDTNKQITEDKITISTYYTISDNGTITYDFDMMAEEFENELSKLDESVVIMLSAETK